MAEATPTEEQQTLIDLLRGILAEYGLEGMTDWLIGSVIAGKDELTILTELRQTEEYKARFPAMAEINRRASAGQGVAINEGEYLQIERAYRQVLADSGLPPTMWDTPDDFARLMVEDVSPTEVQRRVAAAKESVNNTDANSRLALMDMYGITTQDLMAYALDPTRGAEYIQKVATSSILAGYSRTAGLANLSTAQWESYAQDLINQQVTDDELRNLVSGADLLSETQQRLAEIEGGSFTTTDAMDIAIRKDSDKMLASERRAAREKARFSGSSGVSTGTLRGGSI